MTSTLPDIERALRLLRLSGVRDTLETRVLQAQGIQPALPDTGLPPAGKPERRKVGRKPLPAYLKRERIEYDLPEEQRGCACCGNPMHRIGEDISEQLCSTDG